MLSRAGLALTLILGSATAVAATTTDSTVICPPGSPVCWIEVDDPGQPAPPPPVGGGPGTSTGGTRQCIIDRTGVVVPCFRELWGWFNDRDDCYYQLVEPQPDAVNSAWEGNYPDGAIYAVTCPDPLNAPGTNGGWTWLPSPPDGYGATETTPGELAARAVEQMQLTGPAIRMTVAADQSGLVGVPVWLWTEVTPTTWGPNSATAAVPGLAITATAQATRIVWDMGDGNAVTCLNPGTPYYSGGVESPTCDYVYSASSAGEPGDAYTLTATATWEVTWTGGGTSGTLTVTRSSSATLRIGELQVLVTS